VSERVGNVDVLRAVAALMVLAGHAYFLSGRTVSVIAERWYDVVVITGASGVWLFFAISGYVIARPFINALLTGGALPALGPYALRRAVRIYPLYWVALTAFLLIAGAGVVRGWHYPLHYLLLQNVVPGREQAMLTVAWTLSIEVIFYTAVPLLALTVRRWRRAVTAEWLAAAVLASWAASIAFMVGADFLVAVTSIEGPWSRSLFPAVWQMFCPGLLVAIGPHLTSPAWRRWLVDIPRGRPALVGAAVLLVAAAIVAPLSPQRWGLEVFVFVIDATRVPFAIGFGIVLAAAVAARQVRASVPLRLGLVSYGIYLIHPVVIEALLRWGVPLPREGMGPYLVHLAVIAGLTIPLALLSWRYLEEPLIRRARQYGVVRDPVPAGQDAAGRTGDKVAG